MKNTTHYSNCKEKKRVYFIVISGFKDSECPFIYQLDLKINKASLHSIALPKK
jgi:hypothetical protein